MKTLKSSKKRTLKLFNFTRIRISNLMSHKLKGGTVDPRTDGLYGVTTDC